MGQRQPHRLSHLRQPLVPATGTSTTRHPSGEPGRMAGPAPRPWQPPGRLPRARRPLPSDRCRHPCRPNELRVRPGDRGSYSSCGRGRSAAKPLVTGIRAPHQRSASRGARLARSGPIHGRLGRQPTAPAHPIVTLSYIHGRYMILPQGAQECPTRGDSRFTKRQNVDPVDGEAHAPERVWTRPHQPRIQPDAAASRSIEEGYFVPTPRKTAGETGHADRFKSHRYRSYHPPDLRKRRAGGCFACGHVHQLSGRTPARDPPDPN
jgi:hypothetical protein